jgi:vacuolar-type H+-ATPase subunit E/Vma4
MALQDIVRALDEQADAECRETLDNAKLQAKAVTTEAKEEAERIRQRKVGDAEARVKTKVAQITNAAKLENKRDVAALKDRAISSVFDDATRALGALRGSDRYEALLRDLAREAFESVEGAVDVAVDPRDEKLATKVLMDMGVDFTLTTGLESAGGLVVITGAGRISRRNTFEDRLSKVHHIAQSQVAEILFE